MVHTKFLCFFLPLCASIAILHMKHVKFISLNLYLGKKIFTRRKSYNVYYFADSPTAQQTKKAVSQFIQFNQSFKSLEQFTSIVNRTPGARYQLPTTKYKIKKLCFPIFDNEYYIKCSTCMKYTMTTSDKVQCGNCEDSLKRGISEYFVYIPIYPQLEKSIIDNFEEIMSYRERFIETKNVITDIQDASQFKISQEKHSKKIVLSLTVNTDGAQMFNSTNTSIWPIQICQNFLPPHMRYVPDNILVVGLHRGKPNMKEFFYPLLNELKKIHDEGGTKINKTGADYTFLPLITICSADLPAKAAIQGTVSHNGHYACGYCMHKGEKTKKNKHSKTVIRYTRADCLNRTHNDMLNIYKKLKSNPLNGIKEMSCMIAAYDFDLINGFAIDYMHCVLLGITKKLLDLWLNSENHNEPYYISKQKQIVLSKRIVCVKPICEISRKPRSIFDRKNFKANEFRTLLLYILRYCLIDILPMRYINHFQLLSSSIYMLLQAKISQENISLAEIRLNKFCDDFEDLYHVHNVTLNLHLLRHLANSVRHNGPLWAQSTFSFETNNGVLIRTTHAKSHFLMDIAWKYGMKKTLKHEKVEKNIHVGGLTTVRICSEQKSILNKFGFAIESDIIKIYKFFSLRDIKFTSLKAKEVSTVDYFIELNTGEIGLVHYYLVLNDTAYAFVQMYEEIGKSDHLKEVKPLKKKIVINVELIKRKLMYIKIGSKYEIVVGIPNHYEKT